MNEDKVLKEAFQKLSDEIFAPGGGWEKIEFTLKKTGHIRQKSKWKTVFLMNRFAASFIIVSMLSLITLTFMPEVRPEMKNAFWNSVTWFREVTKIPIYIPEEWTPQNQKDNELFTHYYFDVNTSEDSYNISLYYSKDPIPLEKATKLPKPLSESQYVGSINGSAIDKSSFPITANHGE